MSKLKPSLKRLIIIFGAILLLVAIYFAFIRVHIPHKPEKYGNVYSLLTEHDWDDHLSNTLSYTADGEYYYHYDGSPVDFSDLTPNYSFDEKYRSIKVFGDNFLFTSKQKITYIDRNYLVLTKPLPQTQSFMTYNPDLSDMFKYALEDNWIFVQLHSLGNGKATVAPYDYKEDDALTTLKTTLGFKCYIATSEDINKEVKELDRLSEDKAQNMIDSQSTAFIRFNARGKITQVVFFELEK